MNKVQLIILPALLLSTVMYAQPGSSRVVIEAPFTPRINTDAQKIYETPAIQDTGSTRFEPQYELNSRRMNTIYEIDPIKAASVKGEPLTKLYRGYVKAGFGTYNTPYGELYYNNLRSRKYSAGIHYKHLSSSGQIADAGYSGYSTNNLNLFGKQFIKKSTLSGGLNYRRDVVHYYGFNTNPQDPVWVPYDLNRSAIRQHYQLVGLNASLGDNYPVDSQATKYKAGLDYYNYSDKFDAQENRFRAAGDVSFYYRSYDLNAQASLDYFGHENSLDQHNMTIFNLRPQVTFNQPKWRLKAALTTYITSDSTNGFLIAPEMDFDFHIYKNIIIFNAGTDSRLRRTSYRSLTEENPFLISDVTTANAWAPFRLYGGLRGALGSRMAFNVRVSYVQVENQHFFVNDTLTYRFVNNDTLSGDLNKLNVVYDNASLVQVNGEITWQQNEKIRFIAKADYFGYTPDIELKAWHTPMLRLSFSGKYNLRDKIWITPTILTLSKQYSREFRLNSTTGLQEVYARELEGITDINIGIEYRYTKRLGMFAQFNNILNVRYQRWRDYPTQRFNLLAGVSYAF